MILEAQINAEAAYSALIRYLRTQHAVLNVTVVTDLQRALGHLAVPAGATVPE